MAKPKRHYHMRKRPHRRLFTSAVGRDVEAFRAGVNARLEHIPDHLRRGRFRNPRARVKATGAYDADLHLAYTIVREAIGLPLDHPPTRAAQLNVRRPRTRSPIARRRAKKRREPRTTKPRIITAAQIGLRFQWVFGSTGWIYRGGGHYSAGERAADASALISLGRSFHGYHLSLGWGGCSYPALVADDGTILFANPVDRKSAQVASNNTGMVGTCAPGTTGDRLTARQKASLEWLMPSWHTRAVPAAYRLPRPAAQLDWRGHHEFPGQSTACPGDMLPDYKEVWR